ncbi:MAG TPA: hypothetical protein VFM68_02725 [Candidatus Saccharimonadales bacterium]|nr:hypothetical protein [Candidatus Saccharimonadales bacterium]
MKKLSQTLAVFALIVAPFAVSGNASAQDHTISNTGPGSDNSIVVEEEYTCEVANENEVTINNENLQVADSGDAESEDSTTAGDARTGTATNSNGTVFEVEITNDTCEVVTATVPTPVTPQEDKETPVVPGQGATTPPSTPVTPVAAPQAAAPEVLPNTSASSAIAYIVAGVSALATTVLGSRFAVSTYSRLKS